MKEAAVSNNDHHSHNNENSHEEGKDNNVESFKGVSIYHNDDDDDNNNNKDIEVDISSQKSSSDGEETTTFPGGGNGTDTAALNKQQRLEQEKERLYAGKETKAVRRLKWIVFLLLFASMMAVALSAYFFSAQEEYNTFQDQYYEEAQKVLSTMGSNLERTLQASDAFVVSIASEAHDSNQQWPFVVVPNFAVKAEKIRSLSHAIYVSTYHLVQQQDRKAWEEFTAKTGNTWINESLTVMEAFEDVDYWQIIWDYESWDVIWDYDEFDKPNPGQEGVTYEGPYFPFWQVQPAIPTEPLYNW
jgi:hypothetical protein